MAPWEEAFGMALCKGLTRVWGTLKLCKPSFNDHWPFQLRFEQWWLDVIAAAECSLQIWMLGLFITAYVLGCHPEHTHCRKWIHPEWMNEWMRVTLKITPVFWLWITEKDKEKESRPTSWFGSKHNELNSNVLKRKLSYTPGENLHLVMQLERIKGRRERERAMRFGPLLHEDLGLDDRESII